MCSVDESFEGEKRLRHRLERPAMDRARTEFMELGEGQFRAVALMLAEAIIGKIRAEVTHHPVARDLGDDAGGSDAEAEAIALPDGRLGQRGREYRETG